MTDLVTVRRDALLGLLDSATDTFSLETHQELTRLSLLRLAKWQSGQSFGTFRWHITPAGKQALRDNT